MSRQPPIVTAILLSHDCEAFIAEALRSVLAQDCEQMEVIVSDDASGDDTYAVIQRELQGYEGPHRVTLRRRDANSGSKSAHLNDVFPLATGRYVVSFDGDDVSDPGRVRRTLQAFRENEAVAAVYSDYAYLAEEGEAGGAERRRGVRHPPPGADAARWFARVDAFASGATLAVRRDVLEAFGPLDPAIHEDVVLPFRASLLGEVRFIDVPLVRVRRWHGSLTAGRERFTSVERYRAWFLKGIAQARRQLDSRLGDLQQAEALGLREPGELEALRQIARDSLAAAEAGADLVSPSLARRASCAMRIAKRGIDREDLALTAALVLAPGLYLRYKRRKQ